MPRSALLLAVVALVLWNAAFALRSRWGVWIPILSAAAVLDVLALRLQPRLRPAMVRPRAVLVAVLAAAVQIGATYLLYPVAVELFPPLKAQAAELYRVLGHPTSAWQAWLAVPLVVISEELIYRGALQSLLERRTGRVLAVVAASCIYAAAHLASGSWALVGLALVCGAYWGLVKEVGGGLFAAAVCHLLWDWAILVVAPLPR